MIYALGIVIFIGGLLLSIALHELGHLTTAKMFGVKVTQYMVGFGRTVWSRKRGDTEYGLKAVPLGGYIRMVGMLPPGDDGRLRRRSTSPFRGMIEDARAASYEQIGPGDEERLFYTRAPWKRVIVMFAGPFMNLVIAVVLLFIVLMGIGAPTGDATTKVSAVSDCVLPANSKLSTCPKDAKASPARAAGFQPGDTIVAFQGHPVSSWDNVQRLIRSARGKVEVVVSRGGHRVSLHPTVIRTLRPRSIDDPTLTTVGFLGLSPTQEVRRYTLGETANTMGQTVGRTWDALLRIPQRVPALWGAAFQGQARSVNSPVGIVGASRLGGEVLSLDEPVSQRIGFFLSLVAGFNVSLFLFNMLPLLPLDGGHMAGAIWESARRRLARVRGRPDPGPFDVAKLMPAAYLVAVVFIAFSALVLVADLVNPVTIG